MYSHLRVKRIYNLYILQHKIYPQPRMQVFGPDTPTLQGDHALRDGKAQAKAVTTGPGGAQAREGAEHHVELVLWHTGPLVIDTQPPLRSFTVGRQFHGAVGR